MTADFRSLCAKLYAIFEKYDDESNLAGIRDDLKSDGNDILDRARDALAEPEPESELRNNTLSPAAYAIIAAAHQQGHTNRRGLAAALRTAADHIDDASDGLECQDILLQIADELEHTS